VTWWRCEFGRDGALRSIEPCPDRRVGTEILVYVEAWDEHEARRRAARERQRILQGIRHANRELQGLCRCGRERDDPTRKRCADCRRREHNDHARSRARCRGEAVSPPPKAIAFAKRREEVRQQIRLETLLEVQEALLSKGPAFLRWFHAEIAKLRKGVAA